MKINGIVTAPKTLVGNSFELRVQSIDQTSNELNWTLDDTHKRNEYGAREYRTYRGKEIPIFNPPSGLG